MDNEPIPPTAAVAFGSVGEAERRIAGVAAAARIVRELGEAGFAEIWLEIPAGAALGEPAMNDIRRLAGAASVRLGSPTAGGPVARYCGTRLIPAEALREGRREEGIELHRPGAAAQILRGTGKASDGPVSRWLNRPVSRRISALLLHLPGVRPTHATAGTALLALAMVGALIWGGNSGLIAGGLLFQAASVFDGVDGEMARATFRSSRAGAALDTAIDTATNVMFMIGLTVNLWLRGDQDTVWLAAWGLGLFAFGLVTIALHARWTGGRFSFNRIKRHFNDRAAGTNFDGIIRFATTVASRDFFALLFAVLILVGQPFGPLYLFAAAAPVWVGFVLASLVPSRAAEA